MTLQIQPATKFRQFGRVCIWGTPKAGKSHMALALALALAGKNGKVGVISSEYASSQLLQHRFPHDIINLAEVDENSNLVKDAFSPARYEEAIRLFTKAGYSVIVIDSLSHVWEGEGGILESVNKPGQNTFSDGWGEATPVYKKLINTILAARCHIIITLRAKDAYVMTEYTNRKGEKVMGPKNVGQAPVMRKGFGYEMHLILRMQNMTAQVEATAMQDYIPCGEETDDVGEDFAQRLLDALDGVPLPEPTEQQKAMRTLLDEFYSLSPATYAKITAWETLALRAALGVKQGPLPTEYTDEHVELMRAYVDFKRRGKEVKQLPAPEVSAPPVPQRPTPTEADPEQATTAAAPTDAQPAPDRPVPPSLPEQSSPSLENLVKETKIRAQRLGLANDIREWAGLLATCKVQSIKSGADLAAVNAHLDQFEQEATSNEAPPTDPVPAELPIPLATEQQRSSIQKLCQHLDRAVPDMSRMTQEQAGQLLKELSAAYKEFRSALPVR